MKGSALKVKARLCLRKTNQVATRMATSRLGMRPHGHYPASLVSLEFTAVK